VGGKSAASTQFLINPDSSATALQHSYQQSRSVAKQEEHGEKTVAAFCLQSISLYACSVNIPEIYYMEPITLFLLQRKSCSLLLSPLKIHRPQPGLNLQTLGPVAKLKLDIKRLHAQK
jgi:hypothetical protein